MALPIKYYNTWEQFEDIQSTNFIANETLDGTVTIPTDRFTIGHNVPSGINKTFFSFPVNFSGANSRRILPQSYIKFGNVGLYNVPFSGRLHCELATSSTAMSISTSGISDRSKTTSYFEITNRDFAIGYSEMRALCDWSSDE